MKNTLLIIAIVFTISMSTQAQDDIAALDAIMISQDVKVKLKEGVEQIVYIDGKKYDSDIFNLLDLDKIDSISVIKGEEAIKKYNAANVVVITTKKDFVIKCMEFTINEEEKPNENKPKDSKSIENITLNSLNFKDLSGPNVPVFVLDGKIVDGERINELAPIDISNIKILKDEKTKKKYNTEVGVIFVITKEKSDK